LSYTTDLIGTGAETLSLVLIVASFLIVAYLAYRAKTIRSFQFEIFVVLLVLTLGEVPRILNSLGIVNVSGIETTGLIIHTTSMVFLTVFIALRAARYLK
jgi:hypothetical protein